MSNESRNEAELIDVARLYMQGHLSLEEFNTVRKANAVDYKALAYDMVSQRQPKTFFQTLSEVLFR